MKKGKKYFIRLAAKKLFEELEGVYGPLHAIVDYYPAFRMYELLYSRTPFTLDEYDQHEVEPYHFVIPRTARRLQKEVKYLRSL